jgi:hypothetical protein
VTDTSLQDASFSAWKLLKKEAFFGINPLENPV